MREAIRLRDAGQSASQIAQQLEQLKERVTILAAVDTLEYLVKGGRLSKAAGFAGSLLGIHPMITLAEGKISLSAVSTYNTDYILIKEPDFGRALALLEQSGCRIH